MGQKLKWANFVNNPFYKSIQICTDFPGYVIGGATPLLWTCRKPAVTEHFAFKLFQNTVNVIGSAKSNSLEVKGL